jgi:hypothetical protein
MPTLVNVGTPVSSPTSGVTTLPVPTGTAEGDVLVITCSFRQVEPELWGPSRFDGWVRVDPVLPGIGSLMMWWKRAGASETAPTITHALTSATLWVMTAWRDCKPTGSPFKVYATSANASSATATLPAVTPPDNNSLIAAFVAAQDGVTFSDWQFSTAGALTEQFDASSTSGSGVVSQGIATLAQGTAAATGAGTVTLSSAKISAAVVLAFAPSSAPPATVPAGVDLYANTAILAASGTTIQATVPPVWEDDVLFGLHLASRANVDVTWSGLASPWTSRATIRNSNIRIHVYTVVASAGFASPIVVISNTTNAWSSTGFAVRNVDPDDPYDTTPVTSSGSGTTFTPTGLTTVDASSLAVSYVTSIDDVTFSLSVDQGFGLDYSVNTPLGSDHASGGASKVIDPAGAVTMPTWAQTLNVAWVAVSDAYRLAPTPPPPSPGGNRMGGTGAIRKPPRR